MMRSATQNFPFIDLGNPADAIPAVRSHLGKVFHAVEVNWNILSFFAGSFFANRVGFIDVINAFDFLIVRAVIGKCYGKH
jgi:hypothetical protein